MDKFESLRARLKKLQALQADGSGASEAEIASVRNKISFLCLKYGVSVDPVLGSQENELIYREFNLGCTDRRAFPLFLRCLTKVAPDAGSRHYTRDRRVVRVECTGVEFITVNQLYEWHRDTYKKELKKVLSAFDFAYVMKHNLWFDVELKESTSELTPEDLDMLRRVRNLSHDMDDASFYKRLSSPLLKE